MAERVVEGRYNVKFDLQEVLADVSTEDIIQHFKDSDCFDDLWCDVLAEIDKCDILEKIGVDDVRQWLSENGGEE